MANYQHDTIFAERILDLSVKIKQEARIIGLAEAGVLAYKAGYEAAGDLIMAKVKELEGVENGS